MANQARLRGVMVTREQVLRAFHEFSLEPPTDWISNKAQKFVVVHEGQPFPPKRVLSIATGVPVRDFSGGAEANGILTELGFLVSRKEAFTRRD